MKFLIGFACGLAIVVYLAKYIISTYAIISGGI